MIADMHCHILPGLDDGSRSMEETLQMLQIAAKEGITHMVCTPHFKFGRRNAGRNTVRQRLSEVQNMAEEAGLDITLYPGNEMYYFGDFAAEMEKHGIYTMNESGFLLVEFSPNEQFSYIRNGLNEIIGMEYQPVLAHIERYECMLRHPEYADDLRRLGVRIQINASSVTGEVGWTLKAYTKKLLKNGIVDYIATDAHSSGRRAPYIRKCRDYLYKKFDRDYADALLYENARRDFRL